MAAGDDDGDDGRAAAGDDNGRALIDECARTSERGQWMVDGNKQRPTINGSAAAGKRQSRTTSRRRRFACAWEGVGVGELVAFAFEAAV